MSSSTGDAERAYMRDRNAAVVEDTEHERSEDAKKEKEELDQNLCSADAIKLKEEGNEHFRNGRDEEAADTYSSALRSAHLTDDERAVLLANRAAARLRLSQYDDVISDASRALELRPGYQKALIRRKRAAEMTNNWSMAAKDAKELNAPKSEIAALEFKAKEKAEKETAEAMEQLKGLGNSILSTFGLSLDNFQADKDPETGSYSIRMKQ